MDTEDLERHIDDLESKIERLENEIDNLKDGIKDQIKQALIDHGLIAKPQYWGDDW